MPADSNQLEIARALEILSQIDRSSAFFANTAQLLDSQLVVNAPPILEATPPGPPKKLTIGMATYDDYDGVYFSVQAIRLYHPEITDSTDILVLDNHPEGPCAPALKKLEKSVKGYRYIPADDVHGTAVRDRIFREANSEFVLCMDSHVLFAPGALQALLNYFSTHPGTRDLLQGPLMADNLGTAATHFDPLWSAGMWGKWTLDSRGLDPTADAFEIPMQGLGVFACRRDCWPGFNPRLRGFGGEEGYIHEKFRQASATTLCLPFLRWMHRFERPYGARYAPTWEDRIRNYWLIFDELGWDPAPLRKHFEEFTGEETTRKLVASAERELASPFHFFEAIYCINLDRQVDRWTEVMRQFQKVGIADRVGRFFAVETPSNHHIGCALSHRRIIERARKQGLRTVLIFEDDVMFSADAVEVLGRNLRELEGRSWSTLYFGGHAWGRQFEKAAGCQHLEVPHGMTCNHAIGYHYSIYDRILSDIPAGAAEVALWLKTHAGIDQYYASDLDGFHLVTSPVIATQRSILDSETREFG